MMGKTLYLPNNYVIPVTHAGITLPHEVIVASKAKPSQTNGQTRHELVLEMQAVVEAR